MGFLTILLVVGDGTARHDDDGHSHEDLELRFWLLIGVGTLAIALLVVLLARSRRLQESQR